MFPNSVDNYFKLKQLAVRHNHRYLLLLDGESSDCVNTAQLIWQCETEISNNCVWLGSASEKSVPAKPHNNAKSILGQEFSLVVFNGFDGVSVSALAAAAGTLKGGGVFLLLLPQLEQLECFSDPALPGLTGIDADQQPPSHPFLARLKRLLGSSDAVWRLSDFDIDKLLTVEKEGDGTEPVNSIDSPLTFPFLTADQQAASAEIIKHSLSRTRRPLVLMADRGRGKSSALGIAAAQIMRQKSTRILITAPNPSAVESAFMMARSLCADGIIDGSAQNHALSIQTADSSLQFIAPDRLLESQSECDLLLVDEAAAIPVKMLAKMVSFYSRIIFSTTVHGYEGTGRGFVVRFFDHLDTYTPAWQLLKMSEPVRWAKDDPLEKFLFNALLLDSEAAKLQHDSAVAFDEIEYRLVQGSAMLTDEFQLKQICGLLISAHYQTRPEDIRAILDNPRMYCLVQSHRHQVIGIVLILLEGPLSDCLLEDIWLNQRRPRGHLLPVSLSAQVGLKQAPALRYARVMRIAVHPAQQRRGLGSQLLRQLPECIADLGCDIIGTSFAASVSVMQFWLNNGYVPVRLGFQRDASSGEHSVMMLISLTQRGEDIYQQAVTRFRLDLPEWLGGPLEDVEPDLVCLLLNCTLSNVMEHESTLTSPTDQDLQNLHAFAWGNRNRDDCLGALKRLVYLLATQGKLDGTGSELLAAALMQYRSEAWLVKQFDLPGKKALIQRLRQQVKLALSIGKPD